MAHKTNALTKARSQLKKAEGAYTAKSIKDKLKKADGKTQHAGVKKALPKAKK